MLDGLITAFKDPLLSIVYCSTPELCKFDCNQASVCEYFCSTEDFIYLAKKRQIGRQTDIEREREINGEK